jgi:hypothetical protein
MDDNWRVAQPFPPFLFLTTKHGCPTVKPARRLQIIARASTTMNKTSHVRFFRFALILPVAQLFLALALWVYEPFQLMKEETKALNASLAAKNLPPRLGIQNELFRPSLAGRVLYVMNLPARRVSDFIAVHIHRSTIWGVTWPPGDDPWYPKPGTTIYFIGLSEAIFFLGVILLWLYVGNKIDRFITKQPPTIATKKAGVLIEIAAVLGMAVWLLVDCLKIIAHEECCPRERQIALFGLVWPMALFIYGAIILRSGLRLHRWQRLER